MINILFAAILMHGMKTAYRRSPLLFEGTTISSQEIEPLFKLLGGGVTSPQPTQPTSTSFARQTPQPRNGGTERTSLLV
jgi:hypothetical protein